MPTTETVAYTLTLPDAPTSPVIVSSPHSGSAYPDDLMSTAVLTPLELRSSEDAFVDALVAAAPDLGAPLLAARLPRAYVDLNRAADELDPALIVDAPRQATNPRIAAGLGVIPRVVAEGRPIRHGKMSLAAAQARIAAGHAPYHGELARLVRAQRDRFGLAVLLDVHSMPSEAAQAGPRVSGAAPDVILGDRFGAAADRWVMDAIEAGLTAEGFRVARNTPFAGGYITHHYGRPRRQSHAVQIEINRALYMDEAQIAPHAGFAACQARVTAALGRIVGLGRGRWTMAAE